MYQQLSAFVVKINMDSLLSPFLTEVPDFPEQPILRKLVPSQESRKPRRNPQKPSDSPRLIGTLGGVGGAALGSACSTSTGASLA